MTPEDTVILTGECRLDDPASPDFQAPDLFQDFSGGTRHMILIANSQ
jgi:hypothetical protein